jgi:DNA-binding beta-propeller fold protein YncE
MRDAVLVVGNLGFTATDAILRYDGTGSFMDAVVPQGTAGLDGPCCVTFGPDDNLYVSNPWVGSVLRFNGLSGEFIDEFIPAGRGGLVLPLVLVFHEEFLYVGDPASHAIRRYDAWTGAFVDTFVQDDPAAPLMGIWDPQHFAFGPDGDLYVAAEYADRVLHYDGETGQLLDQLVTADSGFSRPSGMTFGPDGLLYVGGVASSEVRRFDIWTSEMVDVFVAPGSGGLTSPVGITFGPDGNLYVTSADTGEILRYNGRTGEFMGAFVSAGLGGLTGPRTLAFKSKVRVCHRNKTLSVGYQSGFDHLAHADVIGACR